MSTFPDIRPRVHATKRTSGVRIDDDGKITVRVEEGGVATDHRFNFTGLLTDQSFQGTDPIGLVRAGKLGTQERIVIEVFTYHAEGEEDKVPVAGQYYYNIKSHYPFGGTPEQGKTEAPNPNFNTPQTLPVTIFNESTLAGWTTGNTVASAITNPRIYGQLGSVTARREYLKAKLLAILENRDIPFIFGGGSIPVIPPDTLVDPMRLTGTHISATNILDRREQSFIFRLEMLTRAISIDSNLTDEGKFNLLEGEIDLPIEDVFSKVALSTAGDIAGTRARTGWHFRKVNSVGPAPSYKYPDPPSGATWATTYDANIDLGSSAPAGVLNWRQWLRS